MIRNFLIIILFFYILILFQISFLIHFNVGGIIPNLIVIGVIFWNLFESPQKKFGILSAIVGGFFLDIFSQRPIGFHIAFLMVLAIFLKFIFKKYVRIPKLKGV